MAVFTEALSQSDAVPQGIADAPLALGHSYPTISRDDGCIAVTLPNEMIQYIYYLLGPVDFNSARYTCRPWFRASLDRELLIQMLKRGGWWSSFLQILAPLSIARMVHLQQERVMSKWISRESHLANLSKTAFTEVGYTDFSGLVPGSRAGDVQGEVIFTVSLCGRFLLATAGSTVYVYELNHACLYHGPKSRWAVPWPPTESLPLGLLRPVTTIACPRQVISCSMDTSAGRHAVALLMEGRLGMVCDIMAGRLGASKASSASTSNKGSGAGTPGSCGRTPPGCICLENPVWKAPPVEEGPRSVYRSVCHSDDPPRSVALCPQRNCVAFGCAAGIELHWIDALTGHDLSRWFPLTSPSDFLYFLPARKGIDTAKKLRLISSAAALGKCYGPIGHIFQGFETSMMRSGRGAVVAQVARDEGALFPRANALSSHSNMPLRRVVMTARDLTDLESSSSGFLRHVSARTVDHYRAVPLSDGFHILFTDPRTGNLCLGTDAPVGSLNRLLRKVWFRPPAAACSPVPVLYTAGADTSHGVRVVATFSAHSRGNVHYDYEGASEDLGSRYIGTVGTDHADKQVIVFYTIPPDMFHDISRTGKAPPGHEEKGQAEWVRWRREDDYHEVDIYSDPFQDSSVYPLEMQGQAVAICSDVVELALDSGPSMVLWAFSAGGWARTWAMDTGSRGPLTHAAVQPGGGLRRVDRDSNVVMAQVEKPSAADVSATNLARYDGEGSKKNSRPHVASPRMERCRRFGGLLTGWEGDRMSGTLSVDLVEEVSGITRMDVELR